MNKYHTLTDKELTELLNVRDDRAYEEIYRRYWRLLLDAARKVVQDNEQAKDIVQDIFANLWANIGVTDYTNINIRPYLYRAVKNSIINLSNKNKLNSRYVASLKEYLEAGQFVTDEKVRENELTLQIEEEIARLPKRMRKIFEMSRKQYMSRKEIAAATNLSEETVKSQLFRAIKELKKRIGAHMFLQIMVAILWLNRTL